MAESQLLGKSGLWKHGINQCQVSGSVSERENATVGSQGFNHHYYPPMLTYHTVYVLHMLPFSVRDTQSLHSSICCLVQEKGHRAENAQ